MKRMLKYAVAAAAVTLSAHAAQAEFDKASMRYASFLASNYYQTQSDQLFIEEVETGSGGAIKIEPFWQGTMGGSYEMLNLVRSGAVDFAAVVPGFFPSELTFTAVTNALPMVFFEGKKVVNASRVLFEENPSIKAELEKNNMKPLIFRYLPNYRIMCTSPVKTLEDLKGKKILSYGTYVPEVFKAFGAVPVDNDLPDVYENLSRGVLDCAYLHHAGMEFRKWHEVAPYLSDIDFGAINAYTIMMNLQKFNSLSEDTQKLIEEAAAKATEKAIGDMGAKDEEGRAALLAGGAELVVFEEKEKLAEMVPDMVAVWVENMTGQGHGEAAEAVASQVKELTQ
ncbi:MAG: C4-dicarboxylate TRAP transporter substrate-binding protein [Pseudomonadota bacterium]|nr:C4-dicarboxylate TRAP transporter substrate-binding protein [Pseudomonadota bacterium]